jgi:putative (di)nucleoside polyphosphate hydrolase
MPDPAATRDRTLLPYRPCVGVMLIDAGGRIFAGQRIDNDRPAWQMPQGGVDRGEDPRAAALRELHEETGIPPDRVQVIDETPDWLRYDLPDELLGKVWGGRFRGQEQRWFLMRFLGRDDEITLDTEHPEFSEWRWLTASELLDGIVEFKRDIYRQLIDRFRPHLAP